MGYKTRQVMVIATLISAFGVTGGGVGILSAAMPKDPDAVLTKNLVIPPDAKLQQLLDGSKANGARWCYKQLYPKGNAYAERHNDLTATGDMGQFVCMAMYSGGKSQAFLQAPVGKMDPQFESMRNQSPGIRLMALQKRVNPPAPGAERSRAISVCEKHGAAGLFKSLGATKSEIGDLPDGWADFQSADEIHKACVAAVDGIKEAHERV